MSNKDVAGTANEMANANDGNGDDDMCIIQKNSFQCRSPISRADSEFISVRRWMVRREGNSIENGNKKKEIERKQTVHWHVCTQLMEFLLTRSPIICLV